MKQLSIGVTCFGLFWAIWVCDTHGQNTQPRSLARSLELSGRNASQLKAAIALCRGSELERKSIDFLVRHMPVDDLKALSASYLTETVQLAIQARNQTVWAQAVPEAVFLNDVLPYASINERRDRWRKDFHQKFFPLVKDCRTTGEAAQELNKHVFSILKVKYSTQRKKPDQSPYESMETGLASCTGLSVILADACRSVGVPARLAGTPLWVNKRGNHTWVEVWDEGQWKFTGACEYNASGLNRGWFAGIASQADSSRPEHRIYATSFRQTALYFPMVWKQGSKAVPGLDVTGRYTQKQEPKNPKSVVVGVQVYDDDGKRLSIAVQIFDAQGKAVAKGMTRSISNDANDFWELKLLPGKYKAKFQLDQRSLEQEFSVKERPNLIVKLSAIDSSEKNPTK
ncbi:MAG: transglutaminase-like domain-containing protein [Planctomycetota bacterium]|nr:transglutaminase-like domain-containing protein [Planctomycetota bacterium]